MHAFLSSVISGFEDFRNVADQALVDLDHDVIRAEQFSASPQSPRVACLDGVRQSDFVVLILGERYGDPQPSSGLSPTHEEFREAQPSKQLFVFIQQDIKPDANQRAFIKEAQDWATGQYTASFRTPAELRSTLTRAASRWQLSKAAGPVDAKEIAGRAVAQMPTTDRNSYRSAAVVLSVVGGPPQQIFRPSEYEKPQFGRSLMQELSYGERAIFDPTAATKPEVLDHGLRISQEHRFFQIAEDLSLLFALPLERQGSFSSIVEDDVRGAIESSLAFANLAYQKFDSSERLSAIALATTISNAGYSNWVTKRQFEKQESEGSAKMRGRFGGEEIKPVMLRPPVCSRAQFRTQGDKLAEDLMVTLRRQFKD